MAALGKIDLLLQVAGSPVVHPFLGFADLSTRRYEAVIGCSVLQHCRQLVDVANNRVLAAPSQDVSGGDVGTHIAGPAKIDQACAVLLSQQRRASPALCALYGWGKK